MRANATEKQGPGQQACETWLALTALALTRLTGASQVAVMEQAGLPANVDSGSKGDAALWDVAAIINK